MKVYIVTAGWDWEGFSNKAVFLSEDKAKAHAESLKQEYRWDTVDIEEHEVKQ